MVFLDSGTLGLWRCTVLSHVKECGVNQRMIKLSFSSKGKGRGAVASCAQLFL